MENTPTNFTPLPNQGNLAHKKSGMNVILILLVVSSAIVGLALFLILFRPVPQPPAPVIPTATPGPTEITPEISPTPETLLLSPTQSATPSPTKMVRPTVTPTSTTSALPKTGGASPTPTEIILAKISSTLTPTKTSSPTAQAKTTEIPTVGITQYIGILGTVAISVIILGLIF